jgi:hypothetical protein
MVLRKLSGSMEKLISLLEFESRMKYFLFLSKKKELFPFSTKKDS